LPPAASICSAAVWIVPSSFGCGVSVLASSTMFAPSAAARRAIASPMPRLPPDMRMVLPARVLMFLLPLSPFTATSYRERSLGGHADGAVEADGLAVEVAVLDDVLDERCILLRLPQPLRVRHLLSERRLRRLGKPGEHRRLHDPRGDGA